ncbi:facilitated trehalose transporter Tret1-like [Anticarsia gemmatalis]|uniref:facilitated trehalose transporter Tret1-like n=1 Tax=Anticarsia gemmatalis TaxID=129554 RepID=UPI003F767FFD
MNIGRLRQFHAAFASGFGSLVMAIITVWPSYTSELYMSNSTTPLSAPMTKMEESLLGSLPALGAVAGTLMAGPIMDVFGRRNGGVLLTLPFVISWAVISVSTSIKVILAARFFSGIAGGGTLVLAPFLVSEVSEDSIRGFLASIAMFLCCVGNLLSYIIGWWFSYNTIIWINVVISVIGTVLVMLVEETPVYYLQKNREEDARKAIAKYRGVHVSSMIVNDELYKLKQLVSSTAPVELKPITDLTKAEEAERAMLNQEGVPEKSPRMSSFKMLFCTPSSRRAFIVVMTLMTLQVFGGMMPVQVYANKVFTETDPSKANLYTVLFAIIQAAGSLVSAVAADKAGRRVLQLSSAVIVCFCLAGMGFQLQFRIAPPWVTVMLIFTFCFFILVGAGSIPYVLLSEVFVPEVMNLASTIVVEWVWITNFFIIGIFPFMIDFFGMHGAFYTFATISITNAVISYFILPETTGLSIEQIQEVFLPKSKRSQVL